MRVVLGLLMIQLAGCAIPAVAGDNSAAGTWRLDRGKSTLHGRPAPEFVQNEMLRIPPEIYTGSDAKPAMRVSRKPVRSGEPPVYKVEISPDRRTITLTQPATDEGYRAVFERQ